MTSTKYLLPQLPRGGAEYMIVRWLKRTGEPLTIGEPLLVVVNDCLEAALPAPHAGILERALAAEGALVAAGATVATIAVEDATDVGAMPAAQVSVSAIDYPADAMPSDRQVSKLATRISPVARRIAN